MPDNVGGSAVATGRVDTQHNSLHIVRSIGLFDQFHHRFRAHDIISGFSTSDFAYGIDYRNLVLGCVVLCFEGLGIFSQSGEVQIFVILHIHQFFQILNHIALVASLVDEFAFYSLGGRANEHAVCYIVHFFCAQFS